AFLEKELKPVCARVRSNLRKWPEYDKDLGPSEWTLSPSDHGFHNAIQRQDGRWVFVDFEYAGWDDPAKMLADACLHPGVPVPRSLRKPFMERLLDRLDMDGRMAARLRAVYPIVGLKWCLIMLNEFIPISTKRRTFAEGTVSLEQRREQQLENARQKLGEVIQDLEDTDFIPG
ncbi:MAG: hypothetical protein HOH43_23455, partial [Candidatus Latescibacteria bacterium]|nr:hypothetical protein [Candidatus Latescibacterota bacterium]